MSKIAGRDMMSIKNNRKKKNPEIKFEMPKFFIVPMLHVGMPYKRSALKINIKE
jgi:hypothetical protein